MEKAVAAIMRKLASEVNESDGSTETINSILAKTIQSAILAEREECAKALERFGDDSYTAESRNHAYQHAKVIRARSQSAPPNENKAPEAPKPSLATLSYAEHLKN